MAHLPGVKMKDKSLYNSVVLEEICKMGYITKTINPKANSIKTSLINKHYFRKHGKMLIMDKINNIFLSTIDCEEIKIFKF
jgi:hypothetical protein